VNALPDSLRWLAAAWSFAFGAVVGSFLNVVIHRVPAGESIVRPRSRCPGCLTPISWQDNVPVLSWILLRGRCRSCRASISWRYPLVELLGGGAALMALSRHGPSLAGLAEFGFAATLLALTFIDLDTWTLPHVITFPLLGAGLLLSPLHLTPAATFVGSIAGGAAGWIGFAGVAFLGERLMKKEALGFGDVWLLAAIGTWLGLAPLLPVVLLASLQGTVVGVALILLGRAQTGEAARDPAPADDAAGISEGPPPGIDDDWVPPRNAVPFGPFLAAGALEWLWLQGWITKVVPSLKLFT
jgi:leader peptidase (prepilin peptidase)/N-methyltransferase